MRAYLCSLWQRNLRQDLSVFAKALLLASTLRPRRGVEISTVKKSVFECVLHLALPVIAGTSQAFGQPSRISFTEPVLPFCRSCRCSSAHSLEREQLFFWRQSEYEHTQTQTHMKKKTISSNSLWNNFNRYGLVVQLLPFENLHQSNDETKPRNLCKVQQAQWQAA